MKKKIISIALALALICALTVTALAAGTFQKPSSSAGVKATLAAEAAQIRDLLASIAKDRDTLKAIEADNVKFAAQLRTVTGNFKSSGATLSKSMLSQLKALKDQLADLRTQLSASNGKLNSLMTGFKQYRLAKDYPNALAALQQVMAVQQNRIKVKTDIGSVTRQIIDILSGSSGQ